MPGFLVNLDANSDRPNFVPFTPYDELPEDYPTMSPHDMHKEFDDVSTCECTKKCIMHFVKKTWAEMMKYVEEVPQSGLKEIYQFGLKRKAENQLAETVKNREMEKKAMEEEQAKEDEEND